MNKITELNKVLRCPNCKNNQLELRGEKLICKKCKKKFQINEDIPTFITNNELNGTGEYYDEIYKENINLDSLKLIKKNLPFKSVRQEIIKKFVLNNKKTGILLSIGCGIGENEELFYTKEYSLIGTDISLNALKVAKKYCPKGIYFQSKAENLPIKSESIDIILCIDMIEHIFDDELVLNEISRVLKKGGILVLTTAFSGKYEDYNYSSKEVLWRKDSLGEGGDLREYGLNIIKRLKNKDLNLISLRFAGGPLARRINKIKRFLLKKHSSRMEVITGKFIKNNPRYVYYSKFLKIFYRLDYLLFGKKKGELIFLGCQKIK
jgi:SAM-dependent methyltransferase